MSVIKPSNNPTPFGQSGLVNPIPATTATAGKASFDLGFPPITMVQKSLGGLAPDGKDLNGILNHIDQHTVWQTAGGRYYYDSVFAAAVGGYAVGAVVQADDNTKSYINTLAGNTSNPNTGGANWAVWTDKSLRSDLAASTGASLIGTSTGLSQQQVNTTINKQAALTTLATSVDATPFLQSLINAMVDGMTLDLLGKTFRIKKNTGFASQYPSGNQPCLVVNNLQRIKITNGTLLVMEHGQGALDINNSTCVLDGLTIVGAGNFPPLDGTTGRAEKGSSTAGYFNNTLYNSEEVRNNSVNTSGYTTGGYGGNFPRLGGGTGTTWGIWNGGYIFNFGHAIYALNSKIDVIRCDLSYFNGVGVEVDGTSDAVVQRCHIHHNYTGGVLGISQVNGAGHTIPSLVIDNNYIHDIGHPDSRPTDFDIDPGYGVATSNRFDSIAGTRKYTVTNNKFINCKRKGIDAHNGYFVYAAGNEIAGTGYGISVGVTYGAGSQSVNIIGNFIRDVVYQNGGGAGVYLSNEVPQGGGVILVDGDVNIIGNTFLNMGVPINPSSPVATTPLTRAIDLNTIFGVKISNNTFRNTNTLGSIAICTGSSTPRISNHCVITGNIITGLWLYGIFARTIVGEPAIAQGLNPQVICTDNILNLDDISPYYTALTTIGIWQDAGVCRNNRVFLHNKTTGSIVAFPNVSTGGYISVVYDFSTKTITSIQNVGVPDELAIANMIINTSSSVVAIGVPVYYPRIVSAQASIKSSVKSASAFVTRIHTTSTGYSTASAGSIDLRSSTTTADTAFNVFDTTAGTVELVLYF